MTSARELSAGAMGDTIGICDRGRRPPDVQPADQVETGFCVDLDVRDAVDHPGNVGEDPPRGTARRAERRGELHERGPVAERSAQVIAG
jgi:hypothetical protein